MPRSPDRDRGALTVLYPSPDVELEQPGVKTVTQASSSNLSNPVCDFSSASDQSPDDEVKQTEVDIIAVHGLGSDAEWAWIHKDGDQHVNWLRDANMLPKKLPNSRIMVYSYNSKWHEDAPKTRLQFCGQDLAEEVHSLYEIRKRQIIFIGHSLGGNVIQHALLYASERNDLKYLIQSAIGLVFLGCPFKGSKLQPIAKTVARVLHFAGSHDGIIKYLDYEDPTLLDSAQRFSDLLRESTIKTESVHCFFELKDTDYGGKYGFPNLIRGLVVDQNSACIDTCRSHRLDTDHLKMNKYSGPNDQSYNKVSREILGIVKRWNGVGYRLKSSHLLNAVTGAMFDPKDPQRDDCLEGTRADLLQEVDKWVNSADGKLIYWLNGVAGTGKSTIAQTVAKTLYLKKQLGASFFFKRTEDGRNNASRFFSTIAYELVKKFPPLVPPVQEAIDEDPGISGTVLATQFDKLLRQPLIQVKQFPAKTLIIIIDALDECKKDDIETLLKLLPDVKKSNSLQLRFFITSRPDLPINQGFKSIGGTYQDVILHEIPERVIEDDIKLYFNTKLSGLVLPYGLPKDWPGQENVDTLVKKAMPLFISAATLYRYIIDDNYTPRTRLVEVIKDTTLYASEMGSTYMPVLRQFSISPDKNPPTEVTDRFKNIIGAIILLATPLSVAALSNLLQRGRDDINPILNKLHSVLNIPDNTKSADTPVRLFHLSFREFLLEKENKDIGTFLINEKEVHGTLTTQCIKLMQSGLKRNISELPDGYTGPKESSINASGRIPAELQYACRYWIKHLIECQQPEDEMGQALDFLKKHFLHWLEAMSILGLLNEALIAVDDLQSKVEDAESEISKFLYDARRFILKNSHIAEKAPQQLYSSCLFFAPKTSIIRENFKEYLEEETSSCAWEVFNTEDDWSAELQLLESNQVWVWTVAFSPDGKRLASGDDDGIIKIWDSTILKELQELKGHSDSARSVAFSPDGKLLASGSDDKTVMIWDLRVGKRLQTLRGHSKGVNSVVFSLDGELLASGARDKTVRIWNWETGKERLVLTERSGSIEQVAFPPRGRDKDWLLASSSWDGTIRLWDPQSGEYRQSFKAGWSSPIDFSPDGKLLAVGADHEVKVYNPNTREVKTLGRCSGDIRSLAFSQPGSGPPVLATASRNDPITLWDPLGGEEEQQPRPLKMPQLPDALECLAFQPESQVMASASRGEIKLWDTQKTHERPVADDGGRQPIAKLVFSSKEERVAALDNVGVVTLWDSKKVSKIQDIKGIRDIVSSSDCFLALEKWEAKSAIKIWDLDAGKVKCILKHPEAVTYVEFSADCKHMVTVCGDKTVKLWYLDAGEVKHIIKHPEAVTFVEFSPDSKHMVTVCGGKTARLWDLDAGKDKQMLENTAVTGAKFSRNPRLLATYSDRTAILWNLTSGEEVERLDTKRVIEGLSYNGRNLYVYGARSRTGQRGLHDNCGDSEDEGEWRVEFDRGDRGGQPPYTPDDLSVSEDEWVCVRGKNMLWLPAEYRPWYRWKNGPNDTIAIATRSGRLVLIKARRKQLSL